jgi:hypothetical protein
MADRGNKPQPDDDPTVRMSHDDQVRGIAEEERQELEDDEDLDEEDEDEEGGPFS